MQVIGLVGRDHDVQHLENGIVKQSLVFDSVLLSTVDELAANAELELQVPSLELQGSTK